MNGIRKQEELKKTREHNTEREQKAEREKNNKKEQRLAFFEEMINCGEAITSWEYREGFELIRTTSEQLMWNTIFQYLRVPQLLEEYFSTSNNPAIIGSSFGLMWCAALDQDPCEENLFRRYYVVGPIIQSKISRNVIRDAASYADITPNWHRTFIKLLEEIPLISHSLFTHIALMLHCAMSGEQLHNWEITYLSSSSSAKEEEGKNKDLSSGDDRHRTYFREQAILNNIRQGNPDYEASLNEGMQVYSGSPIPNGDPLTQAYVRSTIFISLCVRAAIDGGLSPDRAYSIGDRYLESLYKIRTPMETRQLNHEMYQEFVLAVHDLHHNEQYSKQIQRCMDYIELHPTEELSIHQLADLVGYTPYYLSHKFKEETGKTLNDFIRTVRIERAKSLLTTTDLTVSEIAEQLHFCSGSHFSTQFKKHTGTLPQEYRKQ